MMSKKIQIDAELYYAIYDYFCGSGSDVEYIRSALEQKQAKLRQHALYSVSKNKKLSEEVREVARKNYLEEKGVPDDFRW